jgi:alpha-D-ribose 1-methylphosphonate 5-triphosphate synthase subunit PhnH
MAEAGLEQNADLSGKTAYQPKGAAFLHAKAPNSRDDNLAEVISAWPNLSVATRAAVLALIRHETQAWSSPATPGQPIPPH